MQTETSAESPDSIWVYVRSDADYQAAKAAFARGELRPRIVLVVRGPIDAVRASDFAGARLHVIVAGAGYITRVIGDGYTVLSTYRTVHQADRCYVRDVEGQAACIRQADQCHFARTAVRGGGSIRVLEHPSGTAVFDDELGEVTSLVDAPRC